MGLFLVDRETIVKSFATAAPVGNRDFVLPASCEVIMREAFFKVSVSANDLANATPLLKTLGDHVLVKQVLSALVWHFHFILMSVRANFDILLALLIGNRSFWAYAFTWAETVPLVRQRQGGSFVQGTRPPCQHAPSNPAVDPMFQSETCRTPDGCDAHQHRSQISPCDASG
jgi:hypothetical protein